MAYSGNGQLRGIKKGKKEESDQSEVVLWRKFISREVKEFGFNLPQQGPTENYETRE